jgi:hypothetical protein
LKDLDAIKHRLAVLRIELALALNEVIREMTALHQMWADAEPLAATDNGWSSA